MDCQRGQKSADKIPLVGFVKGMNNDFTIKYQAFFNLSDYYGKTTIKRNTILCSCFLKHSSLEARLAIDLIFR
jgi:hypothetical protein